MRINGKHTIFFTLGFLVCMTGILIVYIHYGHGLVQTVYDGRSIALLNTLIEGQSEHSPAFYYVRTDIVFFGYYIFIFVFGLLFIVPRRSSAQGLLNRVIIALTPAMLCVICLIIAEKIIHASFSWWNAGRLAWTSSLIHGYRTYYGPNAGPVLSTIYGPLAPLSYLPAAFAPTPAAALMIASSLGVAFYFLPLLPLYITGRSTSHGKPFFAVSSFALFCLFVVTSDSLSGAAFSVHADAPAFGIGVLACVFLYRWKAKKRIPLLMLSSLFAVGAVWTKQTMAPLLVALPVFLLLERDSRSFKQYMLSLVISGVALSAFLLWFFDARDLFFNILLVPLRSPWRFQSKTEALACAGYNLAREGLLFTGILVPLIIYSLRQRRGSGKTIGKIRGWLCDNDWTLLLIVAVFLVPTSLLGFAKLGGNHNALAPAIHFIAVAVTVGFGRCLSEPPAVRTEHMQRCLKILFILLLVAYSVIAIPVLVTSQMLRDNPEKAVFEYAKRHPGEVYFPHNTLSSLMAEKKLYHFSFGLVDRKNAGYEVSREHFLDYCPANPKFIAFPEYFQDQYVMKYFPTFSERVIIDELPGMVVYREKP
jgi:hypothetical protein